MPVRYPHYQKRVSITGFTLLEVLVAMAIIATALMAIIKTTGTTAGNTAYLKEKTIAHWVAMDRLAELRAEQEWPSKGTTKDDVESFGQEWEWIQKVSETSIDDMRRVDLSVIPAGGDEDFPLITMSGFLLNPELRATK